jgi:hypothetical protein
MGQGTPIAGPTQVDEQHHHSPSYSAKKKQHQMELCGRGRQPSLARHGGPEHRGPPVGARRRGAHAPVSRSTREYLAVRRGLHASLLQGGTSSL